MADQRRIRIRALGSVQQNGSKGGQHVLAVNRKQMGSGRLNQRGRRPEIRSGAVADIRRSGKGSKEQGSCTRNREDNWVSKSCLNRRSKKTHRTESKGIPHAGIEEKASSDLSTGTGEAEPPGSTIVVGLTGAERRQGCSSHPVTEKQEGRRKREGDQLDRFLGSVQVRVRLNPTQTRSPKPAEPALTLVRSHWMTSAALSWDLTGISKVSKIRLEIPFAPINSL